MGCSVAGVPHVDEWKDDPREDSRAHEHRQPPGRPAHATLKRRLSFKRRLSLAKLESVIREVIARGARRQVRVVVTPLRREVIRLRRKVADLQVTVTTLRRSANGWERLMEVAPAIPPVSEEDAKAARLSPRLIGSLRRRLGLSQTALARLVGVSAPAVAHWEGGVSTPTGQNRANVPVNSTLWTDARAPFLTVIEGLSPDFVAIAGVRVRRQLPPAHGVLDALNAGGKTLERRSYRLSGGQTSIAGRIAHPSRGLGATWRPVLLDAMSGLTNRGA
jgi:DNA-binding transcriptional regulator YiaG